MEHSSHSPHHSDKIKINIWQILTIAFAIILIVSIFTQGFTSFSRISEKKAEEIVVTFVNDNIPGASSSIVSAEKTSGVYKLRLSVNGQEGDSYLTTDGKLLFPTALPLDQPLNTQGQDANPQPSAPSGPVDVAIGNGAVLGNQDAKITIIEFSDFQCPYCEKFYSETFPQLKKEYIDTGKAKLIFRNFPLSFHENAMPSALAAECAKEQGKFWEYHDKLFENQQALDSSSLKKYALDLKLEINKFNDCLDNKKYQSEIQQDIQDGQSAGVTGTPSFFINGIPLEGAQPFSAFKQVIDSQ